MYTKCGKSPFCSDWGPLVLLFLLPNQRPVIKRCHFLFRRTSAFVRNKRCYNNKSRQSRSELAPNCLCTGTNARLLRPTLLCATRGIKPDRSPREGHRQTGRRLSECNSDRVSQSQVPEKHVRRACPHGQEQGRKVRGARAQHARWSP